MATTVTTKPNWAAAVSAVVAAAISTGLYFWTKVDVGWVTAFALPIGFAYHWLVSEGEKKFPWLSVFFLALPSSLPTPVTSTPVTPTPVVPSGTLFVETDKGVWAADVNAMEKANEVTKVPVVPSKAPVRPSKASKGVSKTPQGK